MPGRILALSGASLGRGQSSGLHPDCYFGSGKSFPDALAVPGPAGLCSRGVMGGSPCSKLQAVISLVPLCVSTVLHGEYKITQELQGGPDGRQ